MSTSTPNGADMNATLDRLRERMGQGDLDAVERECMDLHQRHPKHSRCQYMLGLVALQRNQPDDAVRWIRKAVSGGFETAEVYFYLGNTLRLSGDLDGAEAAYRKSMSLDPSYEGTRRNLGFVLADCTTGPGAKADEANEILSALAADEAAAGAILSDALLNRLASVLLMRDQARDALGWLIPNLNDDRGQATYFAMGNAYFSVGDTASAVKAYQTAIARGVPHPQLFNNLGNALRKLGRPDDALAQYRAALALDHGFAGAWGGLGDLLLQKNQVVEARAAYEKVLQLTDGSLGAETSLLLLDLNTVNWRSLADRVDRIEQAIIHDGGAIEPYICMLMTHSPAVQKSSTVQWAARHFVHLKPAFDHGVKRTPGPIRIGYLGAGFQRHPLAYLLTEVLELHDRSRFEVFIYSHGLDDGSTERARLRAAADHFRDVRTQSNGEIAQTIYDDGIDILIDRDGYTENARTEIFAARPAPVQVNYLAFTATMGSTFHDYVVVDPFVAPVGAQSWYTEKLARLPDCYLPNDSKRVVSPVGPSRGECGLPETGFVFCCFNAIRKIRLETFDKWMRILGAVPGSILWLLDGGATACDGFRREAQARGISPSRLVFAKKCPVEEHLARHRLADLFLDTLPYNAHTTAADALLIGCPVVTQEGETFAARVAASLLRAIELPDLIAANDDEFVALATRLATNSDELDRVRTALAENLWTTPLFNTPRYVRHLEAAFATMHQRRMGGLLAEHFAVEPTKI